MWVMEKPSQELSSHSFWRVPRPTVWFGGECASQGYSLEQNSWQRSSTGEKTPPLPGLVRAAGGLKSPHLCFLRGSFSAPSHVPEPAPTGPSLTCWKVLEGPAWPGIWASLLGLAVEEWAVQAQGGGSSLSAGGLSLLSCRTGEGAGSLVRGWCGLC